MSPTVLALAICSPNCVKFMPLVNPGFHYLTILIESRAKYAPMVVNSSEKEAMFRGLAARLLLGCSSLLFEKNEHLEDQEAKDEKLSKAYLYRLRLLGAVSDKK